MSNWQTVKDNWVQIVAGVFVFSVLSGAYVEWRILQNVKSYLQEAGLVAPSRVKAVEEDIDDLEKADDRMDSKIERIVDILLED